jgi:hypothetical protein
MRLVSSVVKLESNKKSRMNPMDLPSLYIAVANVKKCLKRLLILFFVQELLKFTFKDLTTDFICEFLNVVITITLTARTTIVIDSGFVVMKFWTMNFHKFKLSPEPVRISGFQSIIVRHRRVLHSGIS